MTVREKITGVNSEVTCESGNTFSATLDLRAAYKTLQITPNVEIEARYNGAIAKASVVNSTIPLSIDSNLLALSNSNKSRYSISGACDFSVSPSNQVAVTMGTPDVTVVNVDCGNNNRFVGEVDASNVTSKPNATIRVVYGGESAIVTVVNQLIFLGLADGATPPAVTSANEANYTVTGVCDSSIAGSVVLTVDANSSNGSTSCTSNTFSVSVDASGVTTNPIGMTLTHGTQTASIAVVNSRVSLSIDPTALLPFNLKNAARLQCVGGL